MVYTNDTNIPVCIRYGIYWTTTVTTNQVKTKNGSAVHMIIIYGG